MTPAKFATRSSIFCRTFRPMIRPRSTPRPFREQMELDSMDFLDIVMESKNGIEFRSPKKTTRNWPDGNDGGILLQKMVKVGEWSIALGGSARMYDTIIIRRGNVRPGGRNPFGSLRSESLHPRAALHDRRTEFVLSTRTAAISTWVCTPSRIYCKGCHSQGPWRKFLRQLRFKWEEFALLPAMRFANRFPGVIPIQQRYRFAAERNRARVPRPDRCFRNVLVRSATTTISIRLIRTIDPTAHS